MKFLIIGLGIYGSNLAVDLTDLGHEVIAVDSNSVSVDAISDNVASTYILDSTDESALSALPLNNVDIVIVAIGENFGASVKTVAILKKLGVQRIYARAIDEIHQAILQGMQVQRILTPEQRAARDLVNEMEVGAHVDSLSVDPDHYVLRFRAPSVFVGLKYSSLDLPRRYGLSLVAATRLVERRDILGRRDSFPRLIDLGADPEPVVESTDTFTLFGAHSAFRSLFDSLRS